MLLRDLDKLSPQTSVVLVYSPVESLKLFIKDQLYANLGCNRDSVFNISNQKHLREAQLLGEVVPILTNCWLFTVDMDKMQQVIKSVSKNLDSNISGVYYCVTSKYRTFKQAKDLLQDQSGVYDFFGGYFKEKDLLYVYDKLVPEENRLSDELYTFVKESYSSDVDSIFKLFDVLGTGAKITSKSEIVDISGIGGNTIPKYTIELLTSNPTKEKGLKLTIANKLRLVEDLSSVFSWNSIRNLMLDTIYGLSDMKLLYLSGNLYKRYVELNDSFDEKRISRYMRYSYLMGIIPMSKLLRARSLLETNRCNTSLEFLNFLYAYYSNVR